MRIYKNEYIMHIMIKCNASKFIRYTRNAFWHLPVLAARTNRIARIRHRAIAPHGATIAAPPASVVEHTNMMMLSNTNLLSSTNMMLSNTNRSSPNISQIQQIQECKLFRCNFYIYMCL